MGLCSPRSAAATHGSVDREVAGRERSRRWKAISSGLSAANLRAYQEARGLSQEAFADVLGVHRTYMGGVERGERNPSLTNVLKVADALGVLASEIHLEAERAMRGDGG